MTKEEVKFFVDEWITQGESTNDYCERSLIISALKAAEEGNAKEAAKRLRQLVPPPPGTAYVAVDIPDFMLEYEKGSNSE